MCIIRSFRYYDVSPLIRCTTQNIRLVPGQGNLYNREIALQLMAVNKRAACGRFRRYPIDLAMRVLYKQRRPPGTNSRAYLPYQIEPRARSGGLGALCVCAVNACLRRELQVFTHPDARGVWCLVPPLNSFHRTYVVISKILEFVVDLFWSSYVPGIPLMVVALLFSLSPINSRISYFKFGVTKRALLPLLPTTVSCLGRRFFIARRLSALFFPRGLL